MDNETLKARGIFLAGIGLILIGMGTLIKGSTGFVQSWYMSRHMADYIPKVTYSEPITISESDRVTVSNNTVSIPVPGTEQPKFYRLEGTEKE